jgi:aspartate aminotransferase
MELSSLLNRFAEPETLKMAKLGRELRAQGIDVIDLSLGEPDFDTPQHIKEAAKKAIDDNYSHYTPVGGYLDVKEAVCTKLLRDNNLHYKPENIVVSTGAKQSLANAILALVDEGDEVLIPTPFWVTYSELVKIARGTVVMLETSASKGFKISAQELEQAITPKTKLFLFSSPCNPSGTFYNQQELAALVAVFEKYPAVHIISDEIYEYINFVGSHASIASFDSIKERVIVINGLSKGFAMTGWRLGYMAANATIAKACEKLQGQFTSAPSSISQRAAITALTTDLKPTLEMSEAFTQRRKRVLEIVANIPGLITTTPEGAFYIFPDVSAYFGKSFQGEVLANADDICMYLLNTAHVSTVTGRAFGMPKHIRISFANSLEKIEIGFERIRAALAELQ